MSGASDFRVGIFYGDDLFSIEQHTQTFADRIRAKSKEDAAEMDIVRVDAARAKFGEIESAIRVVSFFNSANRLVILQGLLKNRAINEKKFQTQLLALFNETPEGTRIIIPIHAEYVSKPKGYEGFSNTHFLRKWALGDGKAVCSFIEFRLPYANRMADWIMAHVKELGGQCKPAAAAALADLVGVDPGWAHQEILKLMMYQDEPRAIELRDVEELVDYGGAAQIFDLVDAIGLRDVRTAQLQLHRLLERDDPLAIFGMVVRQFRQMLYTREILDNRGSLSQVIARTHTPEFAAKNLMTHAQRFSMSELLEIYHRLLEMDADAKSGGMPMEHSLDLLIYDLGMKKAAALQR